MLNGITIEKGINLLPRTIAIGAGALLALLTLYGAHEAAQGKDLRLPDHCSATLAGGQVACVVTLDGDGTEPKQHPDGKEWDFWFEVSGRTRSLNPQNRAMFANVGTTVAGKAGCQGASYKRGRFRLDTLPPGSHVCVLTGQGQHAELTFEGTTNSPSEPLSFTYVLWG